MNYNNIFAFIRQQKAFTAFMTTLVVLGSFSAVFVARGASAETVFLNVKYSLADPKQNVQTTHTIEFVNKNVLTTTDLTVSYPGSAASTFSGQSSLTGTDVQFYVNGTAWTSGSCGTGAFYEFSKAAQSFSIRPCQQIAANSPVKIIIPVTSANKLTSPNIGSAVTQAVDITIAQPSTSQSQKAKVMILGNNIAMTANVDPIFTFTVASTTAGTNVNGANTTIATEDLAVKFGTLVPGTPTIAAQKLIVSTNAINGFTVTAQTDSEFKSANGATIDAFNVQNAPGATASSTAQPWSNLTSAIPTNDKTWGQIGMTFSSLSSNNWIGNFVMNPVTVMSFASSTRNASSTVGYQVQISDLQEAATDYQTNVIYVATPQF